MTAQIAETLHYNGRKLSMCTEPLNDYFVFRGIEAPFKSNCTALWRGYVGEWEINDDRLYLINLSGSLEDGTDAALEIIFPGFPDRVFAHWYSGIVRIPQGKMLEYIHMDYGSTYEEDLLIEIQKGVVVSLNVRQNGKTEVEDASEVYGIGAMTVFPRSKATKDVE